MLAAVIIMGDQLPLGVCECCPLVCSLANSFFQCVFVPSAFDFPAFQDRHQVFAGGGVDVVL